MKKISKTRFLAICLTVLMTMLSHFSWAGNTITYTSSDGQVVIPSNTADFGTNIVSNVYEDGVGTITFDGPVTSVFFMGCESLTSITIPSSVTSLPSYAFYGCSSLTSIDIPSSIVNIGSAAFDFCYSLASIELPSSVRSIEDYAFNECKSLTSITIPSSVTSISNNAFSSCKSLTSITIPSSVKSIGNYAFGGCYFTRDNFVNKTQLTSSDNWGATIVDYITMDGLIIDKNVVVSCIPNATEVTIPSGVTSIADFAFADCNKLSSVMIPSSVTSIGCRAFLNCYSLDMIEIPSSVGTLEEDAFYGCYFAFDHFINHTSLTSPDHWKAKIAEQRTYDGLLINSDEIIACVPNATSVRIPNTITQIGDYAFSGCHSLTSLIIPSSVVSIGNGVFDDCTHLEKLYVGKNVPTIGNLSSTSHWTISWICTLMVPQGYKSVYQNTLGWGSFDIQEYGDIAIVGCNYLLPSELRLDWGSRHQPGCWAEAIDASTGEVLEDVVWSSNRCVYLATDSHYGSQNLYNPQQYIEAQYPGIATINVSDDLGRTASANIRILADFDASGQVGDNLFYERKYIGESNYYQLIGPYSLTITGSGDMYTSNNNPYDYQPQYQYDENATSLPEGLTSIGSGFFMLQSRLTTINLPSTLERIDQFAFYGTGLKSISLPASMKQIGDEAFGSTSLQTVICEALTPPSISQYTFYDVSSCTLKVPHASMNTYKNDPYWGLFGTISAIDDNTGDDSQDAIGENTIQGHEYVDLGLPSGLLWATCNIGAERPEQNGEYYAWGETSAKSRYDWNTYQLGSQASNNSISAFGINDGRYTLTSANDAAAKNWGSQWSIPSKMQFAELLTNCTWRQTTVNGVLCMEGKGPNSNKILFPYAGAMNITDCQHLGSYGTYWTNEVNAEQCYRGKVFFISKLYPKPEMWDNSGLRYIGNSIRPVSKADDGILEGGFCGYGNDLRYTIYDDLSMKVVGSGHYFNSYSETWQKSQYKKLVKTVSLPEGLSQIGYESFRGNTGLTTITIPESVTSISSYAFADCSKLTSMYVGKVPPSCYQNTFSGIQSTCTLYVPAGCKSLYQQSTGWKDFKNIVEYVTSDNLATTNNVLYFDNIEALTGEACTLAINMKNGNDLITNLEFVLQLPEGVSVTALSLNDERITDHQVSYNVLSAGKLKVMVTSFNRGTIWDNDGDLVYVELKVASNASAGQFPLTLQEVKMRMQSGINITSSNYQGTLSLTDNHLGDVNHDRNITVSDAIGAMNLWLSTETNGLYKKQADMNLDGKINVSDVVRIVEKVINTEQ